MSDRSGRRRTADRNIIADDQALDQISKEAEEKLQARRQARTEAREIRLKEIERQQKEEEEREKSKQQGQTENPKVSSYTGSRRGSDASSESDVSSSLSSDPKDHIRELKHKLRDLEEKYKQAMVTNAQLDNTITTQMFQLELLKEQIEEKDESIVECQREYKSKSREYELLKRDYKNLQNDCDGLKEQMAIKDKLLQDSGLVIVSSEEGVLSLSKSSDLSDISVTAAGATLISQESADILQKAGEGTLGKCNQVTVPVSKSDDFVKPNAVVDHADSVFKPQDVSYSGSTILISDHSDGSVHDSALRKQFIDNSENKEQTVAQVLTTETKVKSLNSKDVNSNEVKRIADFEKTVIKGEVEDKQKIVEGSDVGQLDKDAETIDVHSGIKIEVELLSDGQVTERTENTETPGLSKSMIARLTKMTEGSDHNQGLCTSISFESDVTYHRESEDELLDNDETEDLDKPDKSEVKGKTKFRIGSGELGDATNLPEKSNEFLASPKRVKLKIGEEYTDACSRFGPLTDQFIDELHLQAYKQAGDMFPVESIDDVSSMLVDYDPNETVSVGDITDGRLEEFESNADSGEDESEIRETEEIFFDAAERPDEDMDQKLIPTSGLVADEFVDEHPGCKTNISNPVENIDDVGSMVVCYDPNETVSVGDITDSRLEEFESNAESVDDESECKANIVEGSMAAVSEKSKVLSLADRPGLVVAGGPGRYDPIRFLNGAQSYDDVSSMMVEYDPSETVSVGDVTDVFENVSNSEMTEANVKRKDYVPGNLNTIDKWVRSVSREETEVIDQDIDERNEFASEENLSKENIGRESDTSIQLELFAKDYVQDIIQDSVRIVNATCTQTDDHDMDRSTVSGEPFDDSTPTKAILRENVVLPLQRPSDRSSVEILSPVTHITEQDSHEGIEFFSYKLQTQASVVLSSSGKGDAGEVTLEEKNECMSPTLSDITGYGVCLSGEGLEEMEKYYKDMTTLSEAEKEKGLGEGCNKSMGADIAEQIQFASVAASSTPVKNDVFFDVSESEEKSGTAVDRNEERCSKSEENVKNLDGENVGEEKKDTENASVHGVVDDWAKKDYESAVAASQHSEEPDNNLEKSNDDAKDTCGSAEALDEETEIETTGPKQSYSGTPSKKDRTASASSDSGALSKRKSKKQEKGKGDRKRSSAEARSSASDVDKKSSGSVHSTEGDGEKHGRKGSHSKKKTKDVKDLKDENCSVS